MQSVNISIPTHELQGSGIVPAGKHDLHLYLKVFGAGLPSDAPRTDMVIKLPTIQAAMLAAALLQSVKMTDPTIDVPTLDVSKMFPSAGTTPWSTK
jgi:hypothetical protein